MHKQLGEAARKNEQRLGLSKKATTTVRCFKILGTQIGTGREGTVGYAALLDGDAAQEKR